MLFRTNLPVQHFYLRSTAAALAILLLAFSAASAQTPNRDDAREGPRVAIVPRPHPEGKHADLRVDINAVQIPVTVTDPSGTPVTGLSRDHFRLFEDGVEQPLARLSNDDAPLSVGIVFDASSSMQGKLNETREAVAQLAETTMRGDEFFVVRFSDSPKLVQGFTSDTSQIQGALKSIRADGWTALFDAIRLSVDQMKKARNPRHALVVLSDGADNVSRYTQHETLELLQESDVIVYAIAVNGPMVAPASFKVLKKLSEATGGRMYKVNKVSQLPDTVAKISRALRDRYMLTYYPVNKTRDGKYRRILVKIIQPLDRPSLRASWRNGYYAP